MIEAFLVVLSNPVAGRDDDFNDWYSHVHTRDAVGFRGCLAQQRFVLAADQPQSTPVPWKYLALYECDDSLRFTQEHIDNMNTPRMVIEDSFDASSINDFYYNPWSFRANQPRSAGQGSVVMEQFNVKSDDAAAFRTWYADEYLPARLQDDRILSASFLVLDQAGQMLNYPPEHQYVAVYRLADDAARSAWTDNGGPSHPSVDADSLAISFWDILTQRITKDDIHFPTSSALAAEEAARARIERQASRVVNDGAVLRPTGS